MHCSFQDRDNLYLVMDYLSGGDLRYHIGRERYFSESQTSFIFNLILNLKKKIRIFCCMHCNWIRFHAFKFNNPSRYQT